MSARPCRTVDYDGDRNERLPMFHRTIRVPTELWAAVKYHSQRDGKVIRWVAASAVPSCPDHPPSRSLLPRPPVVPNGVRP